MAIASWIAARSLNEQAIRSRSSNPKLGPGLHRVGCKMICKDPWEIDLLVAVVDGEDLPVVRLVSLDDILGKGNVGASVDGDVCELCQP